MDNQKSPILVAAEAAYKRAVVDPSPDPVVARLAQQAAKAGDTEALVVALRAAAWRAHVQLDNKRAKLLLDRAVRTAERASLPTRLAEVLASRAAVNHELGQIARALRDLDRATAIAPVGVRATLTLQRAALHQNLGYLAEGAALYLSLLAEDSCPSEVWVKAANNLALLEVQRGRFESAETYIQWAARRAPDVGPLLVAIVAQGRAWVAVHAGRLAESMRRFEEAGELYDQVGLPLSEHYVEYADALVELRLLPEAVTMARRAVDELTAAGARLMSAEAELRVARLALLLGELDWARVSATHAAAELRRQGRTAWVARAVLVAHEATAAIGEMTDRRLRSMLGCARTLDQHGMVSDAVDAYLSVGRTAHGLNRWQTADEALARAAKLSRAAPVLVRLKGRVAAALHAQATEEPAAVLRNCRQGLGDLALHRAALPSMELRALASGHGAELGVMGLRALIPKRAPARVFEWMERTRAAALVTVDAAPDDAAASDLAGLRLLQAELTEARRTTGSEPVELLAQIAVVEGNIRRASWSSQATDAELLQVTTTAQLRGMLDESVLVEYGLLDGHLLAAVVTGRGVRIVELGPSEAVQGDIEKLLFALRRLAQPDLSRVRAEAARKSAEAVLDRLRDRLVKPLRIGSGVPVVVVPVGDLQRVPWAPLHDGPMTVVPSAAMWAQTRRARGGNGSGKVALLAGPGLPGATAEIEALRDVHESATILAPPDSTCEAVSAALRGTSLAHIACHGRIRADNPTFSSLLFCDGPLTLHELASKSGPLHRIVLAACDSGVQVSYPGDETLGFVSALLARGAAGLVASSVLVSDLDAVPLMRGLHQHVVRGATLADALHASRAELDLDDRGLFASWCAFNAYGAA